MWVVLPLSSAYADLTMSDHAASPADIRSAVLELAESLDPHSEYDIVKRLLAIADGAPVDPMPAQLAGDVIAEAFRAGMLAGFLTSCEGWNGEYLDIRDGTPPDEALIKHIDDNFIEHFNAYLSGQAGA